MEKALLYLLAVTIFLQIKCNQTTEPPSNAPIANLGPDQTIKVGSYIILDGTGSSAGADDKITRCEWLEDEGNPDKVFIEGHFEGYDNLIKSVGFTTPGFYKFRLVVGNSIKNSAPDEIIIKVNPRDEIVFKDPSLEIHVRYILKKPIEKLTDAVLASLDSVVWYDIIVKEVTSLDGVERCGNLKHLDMGLQRIDDLSPLAKLRGLTFLNLSQNRFIKDISPLRNLKELQFLNLDSNEISDISQLENLTQLINLHLQYNQIHDISIIANMVNLEELWLGDIVNGNISPLTKLDKLRLLWLADCQITDITSIENLQNLRILFLKYNRITDIKPLSKLAKLQRLYLDNNQITDISPLEGLSQLTLLGLNNNKINNILPLINNQGLNSGDVIGLKANPLDEISIVEYIPRLQNRGVLILWP